MTVAFQIFRTPQAHESSEVSQESKLESDDGPGTECAKAPIGLALCHVFDHVLSSLAPSGSIRALL